MRATWVRSRHFVRSTKPKRAEQRRVPRLTTPTIGKITFSNYFFAHVDIAPEFDDNRGLRFKKRGILP